MKPLYKYLAVSSNMLTITRRCCCHLWIRNIAPFFGITQAVRSTAFTLDCSGGFVQTSWYTVVDMCAEFDTRSQPFGITNFPTLPLVHVPESLSPLKLRLDGHVESNVANISSDLGNLRNMCKNVYMARMCIACVDAQDSNARPHGRETTGLGKKRRWELSWMESLTRVVLTFERVSRDGDRRRPL